MGEADQFSNEFGGFFPFYLAKAQRLFHFEGQGQCGLMYYYPGSMLRGDTDCLGAVCTDLGL